MDDLQKCITFLDKIGIKVSFCDSVVDVAENPSDILWEGVLLKDGQLFYTGEAHPGDLLHEAGHLATAPSEIRDCLTGELAPEMALDFDGETNHRYLYWSDRAASAWAFYAAIESGIDSKLPFENGFPLDEGIETWQAIHVGWETGVGSGESCQLYYGGMIESKGAKTMSKWLQG
jgi:hypothetical protein